MQWNVADHFSLRIHELERCRSLPIVVLRNVEKDRRTERRIVTGIGWTSSVGIGNAVVMSQPRLLRSKQETGVGLDGGIFGQLFEQRQIVEHPKRATVSSRDHLALPRIDREIAHLDHRKVQCERLPVRAFVQAKIDGAARADEQQFGLVRVLPKIEHKFVVRQTGRDRCPVLAQIGCLEDVRLEIVQHVAPGCQVSGIFVGVRRLDATDPGVVRQPGRGHFLPILSAVRGDVRETVIRSRPKQIAVERRNRERRYQRIDFRA